MHLKHDMRPKSFGQCNRTWAILHHKPLLHPVSHCLSGNSILSLNKGVSFFFKTFTIWWSLIRYFNFRTIKAVSYCDSCSSVKLLFPDGCIFENSKCQTCVKNLNIDMTLLPEHDGVLEVEVQQDDHLAVARLVERVLDVVVQNVHLKCL